MKPRLSTLARFVCLPENRAALRAVQEVAEGNIAALYLHGPPGTGKSHLASACADEVVRRRGDARVEVVAARDLDLQSSDRTDLDLLVIEDLQFLPERSAAALAHLWDERQALGLATLATAVLPPRQLEAPARLASRLAGGLVVHLEALSAASRRTLLAELAERQDLRLDPEVLHWLADRLTGNARVLEGAVQQLQQVARQNRRLDPALVAALWSDQAANGRPTLERIVERVCSHFGVPDRTVLSAGRQRSALLPRQLGMYLARQLTGLSLGQIGQGFGGRDHTTVLHACRKIEKALAGDAALAGTVRQLSADLA